MRAADLVELMLLAAIWGASFLFMRLGASDFGPVALAAVRVGLAFLMLLPLLLMRGGWHDLRRYWKPIFFVGLTNSALPFLGFSYAALSITAGLSSILNATTPLWGALVVWLWLGDRLTWPRAGGLALGFAGVLALAWDQASFKPGGSGWAIIAGLAAALMYAISASCTKRFLAGVPPLAVATGSQLSATLALSIPALLWWPAAPPSTGAWTAAVLLALVCTGLAYVLFFRLIARIGPTNTIAVTFLIPVFATLWGLLFLDEPITPSMVISGALILLGAGLTTGLISLRRAPAAPAA